MEVGGDFVDFFTLTDGVIGIYLGDVTGKGLPEDILRQMTEAVVSVSCGRPQQDGRTAAVLYPPRL